MESLKKRSKLTAERCNQILRLHLLPFFGKRTFAEVTGETVIEYKAMREAVGAMASTLRKELREFRNLVLLGNPNFEIPSSRKDVRMKFKHRGKTERTAPSLMQVLMVADRLVKESVQYGASYRALFLIQAYTAFRAGTARELKRCEVDLVGGWIDTIQSKVGQRVRVPICRSLAEVVFTPTYHRLRQAVARFGTVNDDSLALVAGLVARVKSDADDGRIAEQMATGKPDGSARVSGLRFRRLLKVQDTEELLSAMSRTIALLGDTVNLQSLAQSVYWWNDQTRKKWAFDYYSKASDEA